MEVRGERKPVPSVEPFQSGLVRFYLGYGIGRFAALAVLPILSHVLGIARFGEFEAAYATLAAAAIVLDAGFGTALVRFVDAGGHGTDDLVAAAGKIQTLASAVAVAVVLPPLVLSAPADSSLVLLGAAVLAFSLIEGYGVIAVGLLRAESDDRRFLWFSGARFVTTVGAVTVGALTAGVAGALLGFALGGAAFGIYGGLRSFRVRHSGTREARRALLRYGLPLMASSLMIWTLSLSDRLFLKALVPEAELARYAANYRVANLIPVFIAGPLVLAWLPTARRLGRTAALTEAITRWHEVFAVIALGSLAVLLAVAHVAVPAVFGPGFDADHLVLVCVGVSGWLGGLYVLIATPLFMRTETKSIAWVALLVSASSLACNGILIPLYGTAGAAVATLGSYVVLCSVAFRVSRRYAGMEWLFAKRSVVTPAVLLLSTLIAAVSTITALLVAAALLGFLMMSRPSVRPTG